MSRVSPSVRDAIINSCGDADVKSGRSTKIDVHHGQQQRLVEIAWHGIGNGSIARVRRVKLKSTATDPGWKNWEGKKVYCASINELSILILSVFLRVAR